LKPALIVWFGQRRKYERKTKHGGYRESAYDEITCDFSHACLYHDVYLLHMAEGLNPYRGNPESHAQNAEAGRAKPFEIMTNNVSEKAVLTYMNDAKLMRDLELQGWPTDEETCQKLWKKHDVGPEQIAAVSKYQRALLAEKENQDQIH
jgi:hypothetical protein